MNLPAILATATYHLVTPDGPILTAACGAELGNGDGHAGVYPATLLEIRRRSIGTCDACATKAAEIIEGRVP